MQAQELAWGGTYGDNVATTETTYTTGGTAAHSDALSGLEHSVDTVHDDWKELSELQGERDVSD